MNKSSWMSFTALPKTLCFCHKLRTISLSSPVFLTGRKRSRNRIWPMRVKDVDLQIWHLIPFLQQHPNICSLICWEILDENGSHCVDIRLQAGGIRAFGSCNFIKENIKRNFYRFTRKTNKRDFPEERRLGSEVRDLKLWWPQGTIHPL